MTTGLLAASLAATCGSDPTDCETPFGGRQGTRLKMSRARAAIAATLSIALPDRLCVGVPDCVVATEETGAVLPVDSAEALAGAVCASAVEADAAASMT